MPDLPTMAEAGVKGYEVAGWYGVVAPARTPKPIITKLNQDIVRALRMPDVGDKMAADGSEPVGNTPEQFGAHIKAEVAKWRDLIQKAGIRAE
jgi:tripartite-type tricarboxylate transporter receptor subunit TctC